MGSLQPTAVGCRQERQHRPDKQDIDGHCCAQSQVVVPRERGEQSLCCNPVSYTHLDVYKRQIYDCTKSQIDIKCLSSLNFL